MAECLSSGRVVADGFGGPAGPEAGSDSTRSVAHVVPLHNGQVRIVVAGRPSRATQPCWRPRLGAAGLLAAAGLAAHMACLSAIERLVPAFPSVPDVLATPLPYVDFGLPGELVFVAFMAVVTTLLFRRQPGNVPSVLCLLGAFYAIRGVLLFLLPLGAPPTAPPLADRFSIYPYPTHAYFPGGHAGVMLILSLAVHARRWRRALLLVTVAFALGTLVARTHYTADAVGGWLVGYAVLGWGRRHLALAPRDARKVRRIFPRPVERAAAALVAMSP